PGAGIRGVVDGHHVALGRAAWAGRGGPLPDAAEALRRRSAIVGTSIAFVAGDGTLARAPGFEDPLRGEPPAAIREMPRSGVGRGGGSWSGRGTGGRWGGWLGRRGARMRSWGRGPLPIRSRRSSARAPAGSR